MKSLARKAGLTLAAAAAALSFTGTAAHAANPVERLHAQTNTSESLRTPAIFSNSVFLVPTNVNTSEQKWEKIGVGGGFFQFKNVASKRCLAAIVGTTIPFTSVCDAANTGQHWTRGFAGDQRIENRRTLTALTRPATGGVELRFYTGLAGQQWHEHAA